MVAHLTATDLTDGVLVYAGTEANDEGVTVVSPKEKIHVVSLTFTLQI